MFAVFILLLAITTATIPTMRDANTTVDVAIIGFC